MVSLIHFGGREKKKLSTGEEVISLIQNHSIKKKSSLKESKKRKDSSKNPKDYCL